VRPTARDREMFSATFGALGSLDAASMAAGLSTFRVRALERGASFLRAGEPATEVALVIEGLLREYFPLGHGSLGHGPLGHGPLGRGRESKATHERTKAFILPGQATGSLADLISGQPSRASIVVEQPARLLTARYAELKQLAARDPAWAAIGRAATERLLLSKSEREWELLAARRRGTLRELPRAPPRARGDRRSPSRGELPGDHARAPVAPPPAAAGARASTTLEVITPRVSPREARDPHQVTAGTAAGASRPAAADGATRRGRSTKPERSAP
jgi:CRP-like cAMP-binding protein